MGQYLIDSNAVIDYLSGKLPINGMDFMNGIIDEVPVLSVISKIEVLGFQTTLESEQILKNFINDSLIIGLFEEIVENTIELRKKFRIKTPDAIIAATALHLDYTLITRNEKDFKIVPQLKIVNPHLL